MARWADLSERQREKFGSKKDFKAAKQPNRRSGGNNAVVKEIVKRHKATPRPAPEPTPRPAEPRRSRRKQPRPHAAPSAPKPDVGSRAQGTPTQVKRIKDYDTTSYGSGSRKAADKLSSADLKELLRQGFSKKKIIKYSERKVAKGTKQGGRAQDLLNKWKEG